MQDFFAENADLLFGKPVADAAVDAGAKGEMLPGLGAIGNEFVGAINLFLVAIA